METKKLTFNDFKLTMQEMRNDEIPVQMGRHLSVLIDGYWYPAKQLVTYTSFVCKCNRWQYSPEEAVALLCELTFIHAQYVDFVVGKPEPVNSSFAILFCCQLKMIQDRLMVF